MELVPLSAVLKVLMPRSSPPLAVPQPRPLHILIVDGDPEAQAAYDKMLQPHGHQVSAVGTARQAADLCRASSPDLVLTDAVLPDGCGFRLAAELCAVQPVPVIVAAAELDAGRIWEQTAPHVLACLSKPARPAELMAAVAVAARCGQRLRELEAEVGRLSQALEERKVIEQAKGRVMRYCRLDEWSAYERLQRLATVRNRKLCELSRAVLAAAELFDDLASAGPVSPAADQIPAAPPRSTRTRPLRGHAGRGS